MAVRNWPRKPDRDLPRLLTRRSVLRGAGCAVAAATIPAWPPVSVGATEASQSPSTADVHAVSAVTTRLSEYMTNARNTALPDAVLEQVKWHVSTPLAP